MTNAAPWQATVLTLFPEMFPGVLGHSLAGKALENGTWALDTVNIRDFATDKHKTVDDNPYGGGAGMVMRADVLDAALTSVNRGTRPVIYLSPRGTPLTQDLVRELAAGEGVVLLCGRYEGVDQRFLDAHKPLEVSMGDYVLSGGEPAALTLLDACVRLLPGVMGKAESHEQDSFEDGLLEYPHYTRPESWAGMDVPAVLKTGHHAEIKAWRQKAAEAVTKARRPDLWQQYCCTSANHSDIVTNK